MVNHTVHVLTHFSFSPALFLTSISALLDCRFDTVAKTCKVFFADFCVFAPVVITLEVAPFDYCSKLLDYVFLDVGDISELLNIEFCQFACKFTISVSTKL